MATRQAKTARVQALLERIFADNDLAWEMLNLSGSGTTYAGSRSFPDGNKRLAVLGDRVLESIMSQEWYESGDTRKDYGDVKAAVTANGHLAAIGNGLGLYSCLNSHPRNPTPNSIIVMATTVEAVLGAVYLDSGENLQEVRDVMTRLGLTYAAGRALLSLVTIQHPPSHKAFIRSMLSANVDIVDVGGIEDPESHYENDQKMLDMAAPRRPGVLDLLNPSSGIVSESQRSRLTFRPVCRLGIG